MCKVTAILKNKQVTLTAIIQELIVKKKLRNCLNRSLQTFIIYKKCYTTGPIKQCIYLKYTV